MRAPVKRWVGYMYVVRSCTVFFFRSKEAWAAGATRAATQASINFPPFFLCCQDTGAASASSSYGMASDLGILDTHQLFSILSLLSGRRCSQHEQQRWREGHPWVSIINFSLYFLCSQDTGAASANISNGVASDLGTEGDPSTFLCFYFALRTRVQPARAAAMVWLAT